MPRQHHPNSLAAYTAEIASGHIRTRTAAVLSTCMTVKAAALTDRDVMSALGFRDPNCVRPRITELVKLGALKQVGNTLDSVTGRKCRLVAPAPAQRRLF